MFINKLSWESGNPIRSFVILHVSCVILFSYWLFQADFTSRRDDWQIIFHVIVNKVTHTIKYTVFGSYLGKTKKWIHLLSKKKKITDLKPFHGSQHEFKPFNSMGAGLIGSVVLTQTSGFSERIVKMLYCYLYLCQLIFLTALCQPEIKPWKLTYCLIYSQLWCHSTHWTGRGAPWRKKGKQGSHVEEEGMNVCRTEQGRKEQSGAKPHFFLQKCFLSVPLAKPFIVYLL